jgi:oxygen-dependent protoporphyrinogen oxidase
MRLIKEPFLKPKRVDDISLAAFVRYRLGQEFLDYAINPFVAGVLLRYPYRFNIGI